MSEVQLEEYQKEVLPLRDERGGETGRVDGRLRLFIVQLILVQFLPLNSEKVWKRGSA